MRHFIILVVATISEDYAFALILFTLLTFVPAHKHHHLHRDKCFLPADREKFYYLPKKGREKILPVIFEKKKKCR
jgi:hypothetical protein